MKIYSFLSTATVLLAAILALTTQGCNKKSTNSSGSPPPSGNNVSIGDNFFNPSSKTVSVGTSITWTNNGGAVHTVTSTIGNELNSGDISPGGAYTHTFNTLGTFNYHCVHHAMNGSITVQ